MLTRLHPLNSSSLALVAAALVAVLIGGVMPASSAARRVSSNCATSQLRLKLGQLVSEKTEQHTATFALLNPGSGSCALDGYPVVTLFDSRGRLLPFVYGHSGDQMITAASPKLVRVPAGGTAYFALNKNACVSAASRVATAIRVRLSGGSRTLSLQLPHYPLIEFCPAGDPGDGITVSPFEPTLTATACRSQRACGPGVEPIRTSGPGAYGVLQRFAPQSASTWWAIVASSRTGRTWLVRTTDSGGRWQDVTPPLKMVYVSSSFFLGRDAAWIEGSIRFETRTELVYRTLDSGRSWRRLATVPADCQLDFVDQRDGWCAVIGAALGSSTVHLYRTVDGGSTWTLVSRTGLYDSGSTPDALPYGCDKTIAFSSLTVGWAASVCAGGSPPLFESEDGGAHWRKLARVPVPKGAPRPPAGASLSLPAVAGSRLALSLDIGGNPRNATAIATSTNDGASWNARLVPGLPHYWKVDLLDVRHWRLSDGRVLLSTDDAGGHWHRWKAPVRMTDAVGAPLTLDFIAPRIGFAVPEANAGPLWRTEDGGHTWKRVTVTAGPFTLPRR